MPSVLSCGERRMVRPSSLSHEIRLASYLPVHRLQCILICFPADPASEVDGAVEATRVVRRFDRFDLVRSSGTPCHS